MTVINGKAYWASVVSPNTTFDSDGVYTLDLSLDSKNKKIAESDGLKIKNKAKRKDGSLNKAPDVIDNMKRPLEGTLIGNGSAVNVLYKTYEWVHKPTGNTGVSADLQAVQVVDLVPYAGDESASAFEEIPDGSVVTSSTTSKQEFAEIPV